jgi:acetyl esterase/lipase
VGHTEINAWGQNDLYSLVVTSTGKLTGWTKNPRAFTPGSAKTTSPICCCIRNGKPIPDPLNVRAILRAFLGGTLDQLRELYLQASPINYVKPNLPPSLLVYAGRDHIVEAKFGRSLYEQLQATGNRALMVEILWPEHAFDAVFNGVSNQLTAFVLQRTFFGLCLKSSNYQPK